jgi:hypothetical protein
VDNVQRYGACSTESRPSAGNPEELRDLPKGLVLQVEQDNHFTDLRGDPGQGILQEIARLPDLDLFWAQGVGVQPQITQRAQIGEFGFYPELTSFLPQKICVICVICDQNPRTSSGASDGVPKKFDLL